MSAEYVEFFCAVKRNFGKLTRQMFFHLVNRLRFWAHFWFELKIGISSDTLQKNQGEFGQAQDIYLVFNG